MFLVTAITKVERTATDRILTSLGVMEELVAADFYDVEVQIDSVTSIYAAEVRPGPNGSQIDWSDAYQDLMMEHGADFPSMNLLLYRVHNGAPVEFPVQLERPNSGVKPTTKSPPVNHE